MPVQLVIYVLPKISTRPLTAFRLRIHLFDTVLVASQNRNCKKHAKPNLYVRKLSPTQTSESAMNNAAKRTGLAMGCDLHYLDLPVFTGHGDDGTPLIEMKPWPFLLPSNMAWG